MTLPQNTNSPLWSTGSKRLILITLALIFVLFILRVKILLPPFIFAVILAYLVEPLVNLVTKRIPIPRIMTLVLIYLVIIAALIAIPASAIPPIVTQVNALITYIPAFIHQLSQLLAELQEPILITEDIIIPINQLNISNRLRFKRFVFDNQILLQVLSSKAPLHLPLFASRSRWAYENIILKKKLIIARNFKRDLF